MLSQKWIHCHSCVHVQVTGLFLDNLVDLLQHIIKVETSATLARVAGARK